MKLLTKLFKPFFQFLFEVLLNLTQQHQNTPFYIIQNELKPFKEGQNKMIPFRPKSNQFEVNSHLFEPKYIYLIIGIEFSVKLTKQHFN